MTDQDALYRAIVASPEEDTPRLVYADWLEENGRAEEAEFIRLDCRLEEAGLELPDYVELVTRREELRLWLTAHASQRRQRLKAGLTLHPGQWWENTSRGFPRLIGLGGNGRLGGKGVKRLAAALEDAFRLIPTRWLTIHNMEFGDFIEFLRQPVVAALDHLTINHMDQHADEVGRVLTSCPGLRNLRALILGFPINPAGAAEFGRSQHFHRLRWLELQAGELTPEAIRSLADGGWFRNLHELALEDGLSDGTFEALCRLPPFPTLRRLGLSGNSLSVSAWQVFARSSTFPGLKSLQLHDSDMLVGQLAAVAGSAGFRLTRLDLRLCSIGDGGLVELLAAPWIESLRRLDLAYNRLGPLAGRSLADSGRLTALQYLDLDGNPLGTGGFRAIAGNRFLRRLDTLLIAAPGFGRSLRPAHLHAFLSGLDAQHLRHLNLSGHPVGPEAAEVLAGEKFGTLRRLGLSNCHLTDAAAAKLLAAPALQDLVELTLDGNEFSTSIKLLRDRRVLPRLSHCPLKGNPIARDLAKKLARRPGVTLQ